jgi:hypothetical protein
VFYLLICVFLPNRKIGWWTLLEWPNPVYLISTKVARRVWPVSRECLLLLGTWSYLRICWRSMTCPTLDFVNCLLDYDSVLHIVNVAVLNYSCTSRPRILHMYGDVNITRENLGLCSALRVFVQRGIFVVPHLLWHGLGFPVSTKGPPYSFASQVTI